MAPLKRRTAVAAFRASVKVGRALARNSYEGHGPRGARSPRRLHQQAIRASLRRATALRRQNHGGETCGADRLRALVSREREPHSRPARQGAGAQLRRHRADYAPRAGGERGHRAAGGRGPGDPPAGHLDQPRALSRQPGHRGGAHRRQRQGLPGAGQCRGPAGGRARVRGRPLRLSVDAADQGDGGGDHRARGSRQGLEHSVHLPLQPDHVHRASPRAGEGDGDTRGLHPRSLLAGLCRAGRLPRARVAVDEPRSHGRSDRCGHHHGRAAGDRHRHPPKGY